MYKHLKKERKRLINDAIKQVDKDLYGLDKTDDRQSKKRLIKNFRLALSTQYAKLIEQFYLDTVTASDIEQYISSLPTLYDGILNYKQEQERKQKQEQFKAKVNARQPVASVLLNDARSAKKLLQEELLRTELQPADTPEEVAAKQNRISRLVKQISDVDLTISSLLDTLKQIMPKRKRGRPRKIEQLEGYQYEDDATKEGEDDEI